MAKADSILQGSSEIEKGAYLGAIASIATADRHASDEEINFLQHLAKAAGLPQDQEDAVIKAAREITEEDTRRCLDVLKTSELKYSLVTDLIAFAKSDNDYSLAEQKTIKQMADYLGVNNDQFSVLDQLTDNAAKVSANAMAGATGVNKTTPAYIPPEKNSFLDSLGFTEKLRSVGIDGGGLLKGLLGVAAPMLLGRMLSGGLNSNRRGMGNGGFFGGGGLGSIFSMLNGAGGGYRRSGGLLSRIFGNRY